MSSLDKDTRATYWRSLEAFEAALDSDPELRELVANEFPEQADDLFDAPSRRRFLQLMGASLALAGVAGAAGCRRWDREEIVPLSNRPDNYVPGVPRHFATAMELGGVADAVVVTSYDGRPIKVEGNPQHPFGTGASTSFAQASVLHLYDPDRSYGVRRQGGPGNWDDFETFVRTRIVGSDGAGLRVLSEATSSPTVAVLREALLAAYPQARWHEYEPLSLDNERLGMQMTLGQAVRPIARLDRARRIVALDADLFATHPARLRYARDYAKGRGAAQDMNRLYAVESTFTSAGVAADHRLPLPSSHMPAFLNALEAGLLEVARLRNAGGNDQSNFDRALQALAKSKDVSFPMLTSEALRFAAALATDLGARENIGRSVLVAGHAQSPEVHAQVAMLNAMLGAVGETLEYRQLPDGDRPGHMEDIRALAAEMMAGDVSTLIILGGNPVYNAPIDVSFGAALQKVETSIHLGEYYDETSAACTWHLPRAHYLESWGDARAYDGTVSIVQPLIEPMWLDEKNRGSKTPIELLALILGRGHVSGEELVRRTVGERIRPGLFSETAWRKALHDGFVAGSAYPVTSVPAPRPVNALPATDLGTATLEVVFIPSSHAFDGRFANNAWLQETPDFITKLTWDNAALINANTAAELGIRTGDLIDIQIGERRLQVVAYTLPGQARGSIALALGHGRTRAGRVAGHAEEGIAATGFDVYGLRTSTTAYVSTGATARSTGRRYELASTQDHWDFPDLTGRKGIAQRAPALVRDVPIETYRKDPAKSVADLEHDVTMPAFVPAANGRSLWAEHDYSGPRPGSHRDTPRNRWGMSIDLDKCTGCNACMLACQAENNVPVVGKEQVMKSREMHWIRIDRYFVGDDLRDNPRIAHQPLTCQQCENAPCEQVCPVGATIHSEEGLNDMVYNRCVGTRYCLNNCPYRVRRFNFLDYLDRPQAPGGPLSDARNKVRQLLFNPEVTVRSRGVMEKCTFCVQRIQNTRIVAKNERRELRDGEIQTACQQACPTGAIQFGDLNDEKSTVRKAHDEPRAYALLGILNTKPRNLFLARLRNPNPQLG